MSLLNTHLRDPVREETRLSAQATGRKRQSARNHYMESESKGKILNQESVCSVLLFAVKFISRGGKDCF